MISLRIVPKYLVANSEEMPCEKQNKQVSHKALLEFRSFFFLDHMRIELFLVRFYEISLKCLRFKLALDSIEA